MRERGGKEGVRERGGKEGVRERGGKEGVREKGEGRWKQVRKECKCRKGWGEGERGR